MTYFNAQGQGRVGWKSPISGGVITPSYLLDTYSGATAAYSLRKLRTAYTGNAIRVRRSSDNTTLDVGFKADGTLDTASMLSFVGAGNGFVPIWYDQSGNGNNQSSTTLIRQPQIVSNGSLITQNSKPGLYFSNNMMQSGRIFSTSNFSIFSTISGIQNQGDVVLLCQHTGNADVGRTVFISPDNNVATYNKLLTFFNNGVSRVILSTNDVFTNQLKLVNITSNGSGTTTQFVNSTQEGQLTGQSWTPVNTVTTLGALGNSANFYTGYVGELVMYTTNQLTNRTGIESNINSFYTIY
jgi:hypothetical protein